MGAEPKATGGPVKPGAFVENDCDYVIRPGAAGMVGPIWGRDALDKIEREAEERGYRKAIADLREEATRSASATTGAAVDRTPGDFKRARAYYSGLDHAADFLESRLTGAGDG